MTIRNKTHKGIGLDLYFHKTHPYLTYLKKGQILNRPLNREGLIEKTRVFPLPLVLELSKPVSCLEVRCVFDRALPTYDNEAG